jgi:SAM-dependent methyltransferase
MSAAPVHADNSAQAEYWNSAAGQKWTEHQEHQDHVLRPVSDRLIAAADPKPGDRVIDVGCGCGATAIDFAARVAPGGEVLGVDISEPMLARARDRGQSLPIRFERADATVYPFKAKSADLVASRFGVMFFADPVKSFANLRKGLKASGRLAFACWREARENPFFVTPLREALKHAPPLPEMDPESPGPFALAAEARVRRILTDAGFTDVALTPADLELDIAGGRGLDTAVRAALTLGPTSRMLDGQSEAVRVAVTADMRKTLAAHARGSSVPLGAAIWIVTAANPA